jgi:hypothetical protein
LGPAALLRAAGFPNEPLAAFTIVP